MSRSLALGLGNISLLTTPRLLERLAREPDPPVVPNRRAGTVGRQSAYRSLAWRDACHEFGISTRRTRYYWPLSGFTLVATAGFA